MEYYLALKRKEILQYCITWINLGNIMLNEISQSQEDLYCVFLYEKCFMCLLAFHLYEVLRVEKIHRWEIRI